MPMIEVTLDDDVMGEKDYTIAFVMTIPPIPHAEGASFEIEHVWDDAGKKVTHGEFDAVAEAALDCYYDEMLEEALER